MDNRDCRILIVGAGIGGLTAALALKKRGLDDVVVLEQAQQLTEVGAGVQIGPNASRVLNRLGLGDDMERVAVRPGALQSRNFRTAQIIRDFPLGDTALERYGAPYYHIHRADLQMALLREFGDRNIALHARCVDLAQDDRGVVVRTADGREFRSQVVIGADGVHSTARSLLFGNEKPRFSGLAAWRGLAPLERLKDFALEKNVNSFWGPHRHFVSYYVSQGRLVNWVGVVPAGEWRLESWSAKGTREEALEDFAGWHPLVRQMIEATDEPFKWALYDRDPMPSWTKGRVTLLGDAAHPMLPFMSQGAAQSIEDGYVIAACLARPGGLSPEGLRNYESLRLERTRWVQLGSRQNGQMFHLASPLSRLWRDLRFKVARYNPRSKERRKTDTLYGFDCDAALSRKFPEITR